jgi:hypothetical protein
MRTATAKAPRRPPSTIAAGAGACIGIWGFGFWRAPKLVLFFTNLVLFSRIWYRFHESGIVFPNLVLFSKRTCPTHDLRRRRPKAPRSPPRTMAAGAGLHFIPTSNRLFQPH